MDGNLVPYLVHKMSFSNLSAVHLRGSEVESHIVRGENESQPWS